MTVVPLHKSRGGGRGNQQDTRSIIAVLDVGSTKICCLIAEVVTLKNRVFGGDRTHQLKLLGLGHQVARGTRHGAVVNMDEAERAIRLAVDAAERMAGHTVDNIYVNVSGGRPQCKGYKGHAHLGGREVNRSDVSKVIRQAQSTVEAGPQRIVLHTTPTSFGLDDTRFIPNPEGMFGDALSVGLNAVSVDRGPMRNLAMVIERCHLGIAGFVIAPYAAGRSVLVPDEMSMGVTCIDMGGGTTSVSIFSDGQLVYADAVPVGGHHITMDIARGLSTPIAHAERMKTLYGSALPAVCDERELVSVPLVGEKGTDSVNKIPRSMLTGIIQPRLEETFELVAARLKSSGLAHFAGRRVVLTGGGSQLNGARELAGSMLDRQVRFGYPQPITGMPESARGPGFAVAAGLLNYAVEPDKATIAMPNISPETGHEPNYLTRVGQWIRESI